MAERAQQPRRAVGLLGATTVGVGAIVGGGIMVLAGVAYENAGPGAMIAFAANGLIAFLTAMSFAEISSAFPENGGAYTFSKKVLSVRAAFSVGWILWFAYIVAGVLYALGFAAFAVEGAIGLTRTLGREPPAWLLSGGLVKLVATAAAVGYAVTLIRKATGGGRLATLGKVVVFCVIILFGVVAVLRQPLGETTGALDPFLPLGGAGLLAAMGFTFIALQGFDLIAAIGGEVKQPSRNIPRAMFLSLGAALVVYIPLLFVVATAGVGPGGAISELAAEQGDTVFAAAVQRFMGVPGYWLIIVAALLSTLSALHANIMAASRVALSMAVDETLPSVLGKVHPVRGTPAMAIYASTLTLIAILFMVPDLAAAGAAASLIFLISFTLAHVTAYLARTRGGPRETGYRTPWFPLVPVLGGLACAGLGIFQAVKVPDAGAVVLMWLGLGVLLYFALFKLRAEMLDASAEGLDPRLAKLRGKEPLVLVPIANPAHARSMIEVANAMAPSEFAKVLLLTIVTGAREEEETLARLDDAQRVVREALSASYLEGHSPEALITTAPSPMKEISRVAQSHHCQSLLIGVGSGDEVTGMEQALEELLNEVDCDVAVMRAHPEWRLGEAKRILVPVGGRGEEHGMRARLLGSLCRGARRDVTFVTVLGTRAKDTEAGETLKNVSQLAEVRVPGTRKVEVLRADDPVAALLEAAEDHDLIILGLKSVGWRRKVFGQIALRVAREAPCPTIMLSRRRSHLYSELYRPIREVIEAGPWTRRG